MREEKKERKKNGAIVQKIGENRIQEDGGDVNRGRCRLRGKKSEKKII